MMLADDIAQQILGDGADIPDDDGDEGFPQDDGVDDGNAPHIQQLPDTAPTKPAPEPTSLHGRNLAGRDAFGYPYRRTRPQDKEGHATSSGDGSPLVGTS